MRTKHYLAALCLPMAFAACSNEDFVNEAPSLEARGTVDVTLTAGKPAFGTANTRLGIGDDYKFIWEEGTDMIGAAMADAKYGTITSDHKVPVNYCFTALTSAETSNFNSQAPISKGHYLFYYGYTDVLDREYLNLNVPEQTYKVKDEKTAIQQAATKMKMIAPIVNLADGVGQVKAQTYNLNLSFVNLYTMVKVTVRAKNLPATAPKIEKITLDASGGNAAKGFVKMAHANLTGIAGDRNANIVTPGEDGMLPVEAMNDAKEAINTLLCAANKDGISAIYDQTDINNDADKYGPVTLNIDGDLSLVAAEEGIVLYLLAPKGTYNEGVKLTVETSEGNYTKTIAKGGGERDVAFGDDIFPIGADLEFGEGGNVELPTTFAIGDLSAWNNAVKFVNDHMSSYFNSGEGITFTLTSDIEIPSLPTFGLSIEGDKVLTLTEDYTFDAKNATKYTVTDTKLGVKKGATLTLGVENPFTGVVNYGTLNVNANQGTAIENFGTMNVSDDAELSAGVTNGQVANTGVTPAIPAIKGIINVLAGKTLTVSTTTGLTNTTEGTINIAKTAIMTISQGSTNNGTIKNEGTIGGTAAITNAGTITNASTGVINISGVNITNTGTVNNYGTLQTIVAGGKLVIEDGSKGHNTNELTTAATVVEVKNVTTFVELQKGNTKYAFAAGTAVTALVSNKGEYTAIAAAGQSTGITNIVLNGGEWNMAGVAGEDNTKTIAKPTQADVKTLTLKGAKLTVDVDDLTMGFAVEGESSIAGKTSARVIIGSLTVNDGATLNVENLATFNAAASSNNKTASIQGTLTVNAGAKMYFETAEVGSATNTSATLTVKGDITTGGAIAQGEFGVKTAASFNNYGTIKAEAGESGYDSRGKVTMPGGNQSGSFSGGSSVINFP